MSWGHDKFKYLSYTLQWNLKKKTFFENFVLHDLCVISQSLEQLHLNLQL